MQCWQLAWVLLRCCWLLVLLLWLQVCPRAGLQMRWRVPPFLCPPLCPYLYPPVVVVRRLARGVRVLASLLRWQSVLRVPRHRVRLRAHLY